MNYVTFKFNICLKSLFKNGKIFLLCINDDYESKTCQGKVLFKFQLVTFFKKKIRKRTLKISLTYCYENKKCKFYLFIYFKIRESSKEFECRSRISKFKLKIFLSK